MFEFGRDLRKLFDKARESDDLGWLELVGADLVEAEARRETVDAGRVSCSRPFDGWMRAAALWREHARRTGRRESLERAAKCASDAARHTATPVAASPIVMKTRWRGSSKRCSISISPPGRLGTGRARRRCGGHR